MSFPWHDGPWCDVADLLDDVEMTADRILAPDPFWWRFPEIWRYVPENLLPGATYEWVVVHKGELEAIPRPFLEQVVATMAPVLANEVFVVFAEPGRRVGGQIDPQSSDFVAFVAALARLPSQPTVEHPVVRDRVLEDSPRLRQFRTMKPDEARRAQDEFFRRGGYRYPTLRDEMYYRELRHHRDRTLRPGARVLDLCSGAFAVGYLPPGVAMVRSDFSPVGIAQAAERDVGIGGVTHIVCDASAASVASSKFDIALIIDSIEHVFDPAMVLSEAARALRVGGELLVTYVNRNSVNQMLTRAMGHPEFLTNHQHVFEFTIDEMRSMLDDVGLTIESTAGVELRPYWGVPGIDQLFRDTIDDDPQFVEMLRVLGERAGVEYAYIGVVRARKRA